MACYKRVRDWNLIWFWGQFRALHYTIVLITSKVMNKVKKWTYRSSWHGRSHNRFPGPAHRCSGFIQNALNTIICHVFFLRNLPLVWIVFHLLPKAPAPSDFSFRQFCVRSLDAPFSDDHPFCVSIPTPRAVFEHLFVSGLPISPTNRIITKTGQKLTP